MPRASRAPPRRLLDIAHLSTTSASALSMEPPYEPSSDSLLRLPAELLLHIRDHLGPSDLLGHASYYQLHPRTQACYAAYDDNSHFWIALLFENGLAVSSFEANASGVGWRKAALECAEHARACAHPACGMQRLEANRARLQEERSSWEREDWDGQSPLDTAHATEFADRITQNHLFELIGFNCEFPPPDLPEDIRGFLVGACAFLRESPGSDDGWLPTDLVGRHPIASRSFSTFPPVQYFSIAEDILERYEDMVVRNCRGATVHDTLTALSTLLGREMDREDIDGLLNISTWPAHEHGILASDWDSEPRAFPHEWPLAHARRTATRMGNLFQLTRWKGFHLGDVYGEPTAFLDFETKPLTHSAWSHIVKYKFPKTLFATMSALNGFGDL
ncbi:hypothetical protein PsYK624_170120 [Phanerochaete sordida]|uniref:F-box domain-containing protein n=1 Tax=Phanerochaete sordida TaxID=48140 RepID=A0A9P3GRX4_9APHY|nr:hypothetical protein PsYK624_170120 [Phanerochaete sordida]